MPTHKSITCTISSAVTRKPFPERGTAFDNNNNVTTYIVAPTIRPTDPEWRPPNGMHPSPTAFTIHVTSSEFIASGLAVFVFIDGVYQCNRNRRNLVPHGPGRKKIESTVDFLVRQKEEWVPGGQWIGKEWRFEELRFGEPVLYPFMSAPKLDHLGIIEVAILRLKDPPPPDIQGHFRDRWGIPFHLPYMSEYGLGGYDGCGDSRSHEGLPISKRDETKGGRGTGRIVELADVFQPDSRGEVLGGRKLRFNKKAPENEVSGRGMARTNLADEIESTRMNRNGAGQNPSASQIRNDDIPFNTNRVTDARRHFPQSDPHDYYLSDWQSKKTSQNVNSNSGDYSNNVAEHQRRQSRGRTQHRSNIKTNHLHGGSSKLPMHFENQGRREGSLLKGRPDRADSVQPNEAIINLAEHLFHGNGVKDKDLIDAQIAHLGNLDRALKNRDHGYQNDGGRSAKRSSHGHYDIPQGRHGGNQPTDRENQGYPYEDVNRGRYDRNSNSRRRSQSGYPNQSYDHAREARFERTNSPQGYTPMRAPSPPQNPRPGSRDMGWSSQGNHERAPGYQNASAGNGGGDWIGRITHRESSNHCKDSGYKGYDDRNPNRSQYDEDWADVIRNIEHPNPSRHTRSLSNAAQINFDHLHGVNTNRSDHGGPNRTGRRGDYDELYDDRGDAGRPENSNGFKPQGRNMSPGRHGYRTGSRGRAVSRPNQSRRVHQPNYSHGDWRQYQTEHRSPSRGRKRYSHENRDSDRERGNHSDHRADLDRSKSRADSRGRGQNDCNADTDHRNFDTVRGDENLPNIDIQVDRSDALKDGGLKNRSRNDSRSTYRGGYRHLSEDHLRPGAVQINLNFGGNRIHYDADAHRQNRGESSRANPRSDNGRNRSANGGNGATFRRKANGGAQNSGSKALTSKKGDSGSKAGSSGKIGSGLPEPKAMDQKAKLSNLNHGIRNLNDPQSNQQGSVHGEHRSKRNSKPYQGNSDRGSGQQENPAAFSNANDRWGGGKDTGQNAEGDWAERGNGNNNTDGGEWSGGNGDVSQNIPGAWNSGGIRNQNDNAGDSGASHDNQKGTGDWNSSWNNNAAEGDCANANANANNSGNGNDHRANDNGHNDPNNIVGRWSGGDENNSGDSANQNYSSVDCWNDNANTSKKGGGLNDDGQDTKSNNGNDWKSGGNSKNNLARSQNDQNDQAANNDWGNGGDNKWATRNTGNPHDTNTGNDEWGNTNNGNTADSNVNNVCNDWRNGNNITNKANEGTDSWNQPPAQIENNATTGDTWHTCVDTPTKDPTSPMRPFPDFAEPQAASEQFSPPVPPMLTTPTFYGLQAHWNTPVGPSVPLYPAIPVLGYNPFLWPTNAGAGLASGHRGRSSSSPFLGEEQSPYIIHKDTVRHRSPLSHQVQPGKPAYWIHQIYKPSYLDSMHEPYIVFKFKYRSKVPEVVETILQSNAETEKTHLLSMLKEQLVEEVLQLKTAAARSSDGVLPTDSASQWAPGNEKEDDRFNFRNTGIDPQEVGGLFQGFLM